MVSASPLVNWFLRISLGKQKVLYLCLSVQGTQKIKNSWLLQVNVHKGPPVGGVDLNRAMSTIYNQTRAFLMHNYAITEDVVCLLLTAA